MNKQVNIDFDKKSNKLVLRCPFYANELVKGLASARWSKTDRAWHAPLTRRNAQQIQASIAPLADVTDAAHAAMTRALDEQASLRIAGDGFPFWYPFKTEPKPYQFEALKQLYPLKPGAIFADMGTGKSKMAIDLAAARRMDGKIDVLVIVCKLTLRDNWLEQLELHCPIPYSAHLPLTTAKAAFDRWRMSKHDFKVLIVGTESLSQGGMSKMLETFVMSAGKVMMVVDESSYIASHDATRTEVCIKVGLQTEYRVAMTGTPLRDSPLNLFSQYEFLDTNIIGIGDFYAFRNRYAVMGGFVPKDGPMKGKPVQVIGYQNLDELADTVSPYTFQVTKEEAGLNLPPKVPQKRIIPMTKEQRELYDQIKKEEAYDVDGEEQVMQTVLETCLRLHQVCGGFKVKSREFERTVRGERRIQRVYDPLPVMPDAANPKLIELGDVLAEARFPTTIIWCAYRPEIDAVARLLHKEVDPGTIAMYHGGLGDTERDEFDKGFKSGKYKYMIANPQTGGMGLTWVKASLVVYYSNTNKMIDRVQSEDRAHRIGQMNNQVNYVDLLMEKSIDMTIWQSNKLKLDLSDYIKSRIKTAAGRAAIFDGELTGQGG